VVSAIIVLYYSVWTNIFQSSVWTGFNYILLLCLTTCFTSIDRQTIIKLLLLNKRPNNHNGGNNIAGMKDK